MCGLLAAWGDFKDDAFMRALDLLKHRGPDDYGRVRYGDLQLGHRRLSIIDLNAAAAQPMRQMGDELTCIFNGEIYNYIELRKELGRRGYVFRTNSDTEVLISAYHCFGAACVDHFIGMFAIVIWDKRRNQLFVARDRLGIKPLYWASWGSGLVIASEVKAILAFDRPKELNLSAVSSFFSYRYPIANDSFYSGIHQIPPAHRAVISVDKKVRPERYWDFTDRISEQGEDRGESYYLEQLKELFTSSVRYRMRSDVPVGAYLSGGVDSSAVVAEMALTGHEPVKTFTIGFTDEGYNEFSYAREVAERYHTDHHEIVLSADDYLESLQTLVLFKDAPLGVPNEVPLYLMSKELKKYITVVLSGEGADEIFGGYGRIFRSADDYVKLEQRRNGLVLPSALANALTERYGSCNFNNQIDHFLFLYRYTSLDQKRQLLGTRFSGRNDDRTLDAAFRIVFDGLPSSAGYATVMMAAFEKLHLPGLLQRVDTTTMAASVEARVPFVDHRLVEFAFTIPEKYKLKWTVDPASVCNVLGNKVSEVYDTPKCILKKAMEDKLSNRVLYRKKMGFPVPLDHWFRGDFNKYAKSKLLKGVSVNEGILNQKYLKELLDNPTLGSDHAMAMKVWMCLSLETFLRAF